MSDTMATRVAADVAAERTRQDAKWGEQNHPDGAGPRRRPLMGIRLAESPLKYARALDLADAARNATDLRAQVGTVTWADILLEEVFEAIAESDPANLRTELVQVAAVAQQWVEAIDRREAKR